MSKLSRSRLEVQITGPLGPTGEPTWYADKAEIAADLTRLAGVMTVDELDFHGGDPLLHPEINQILDSARETGLGLRIMVTSDGAKVGLAVASGLLDRIDALRISRRLVQRDIEQPALEAATKQAKVQLLISTYPEHRDSKAQLHPETAQRVFTQCGLRLLRHVVSRGHYYLCPSCAEQQIINDGIPLASPDLQDRIEALWNKSTSAAACERCLGAVVIRLPRNQTP